MSRKYQFSNEKLTIFVISERWISSVTLTMSAGISPTGVASFSNLINTRVKKFFLRIPSKVTRRLP